MTVNVIIITHSVLDGLAGLSYCGAHLGKMREPQVGPCAVDTPPVRSYNFGVAGESSSGRTHDSGSCRVGSNPTSPANSLAGGGGTKRGLKSSGVGARNRAFQN